MPRRSRSSSWQPGRRARWSSSLAAGVLGWIVVVLVASTLLAQRSLAAHVAAVAQGLEEGGLPAGRAAVGRIVGRDVESLDAAAVARAAVESLAENFADGVVAPVFWMAVLGLPGAAAYKAINTADSMIGHRTERHRAFGWAAARLRRSRQPAGVAAGGASCSSAAACARAGGVAGRGAGGGAAGRARAPLAQRRLAGGGDGGGARVRAGRAAALWRGAGRGRGDGARAGGAISGRATSGGRCGSTGWRTRC